MSGIRVVRAFEGFPTHNRSVKAELASGEVVCELLRCEPANGAGAPIRVVWRMVEAKFDPADQSRLGLNLNRDQELQERFETWFKARHGRAVAEQLYRLATQPARRMEEHGI